MRLILEYVVSDGCSYSFDVTLPVEYESAEALLIDFETALNKSLKDKKYSFDFIGKSFDVNNFNHAILPNISTLDEWFELNKKIKI
jgi:hypothetical protein